MPRDIQRSERGQTRIEVTSIRREPPDESYILITMERSASGLKAGEAVMMSAYLPGPMARALHHKLGEAIETVWPS